MCVAHDNYLMTISFSKSRKCGRENLQRITLLLLTIYVSEKGFITVTLSYNYRLEISSTFSDRSNTY